MCGEIEAWVGYIFPFELYPHQTEILTPSICKCDLPRKVSGEEAILVDANPTGPCPIGTEKLGLAPPSQPQKEAAVLKEGGLITMSPSIAVA